MRAVDPERLFGLEPLSAGLTFAIDKQNEEYRLTFKLIHYKEHYGYIQFLT